MKFKDYHPNKNPISLELTTDEFSLIGNAVLAKAFEESEGGAYHDLALRLMDIGKPIYGNKE